MRSFEKKICEDRWAAIGDKEKQFVKTPTQTDAIALRDLYQNWVSEGWADLGGYRGFATERAAMYSELIQGKRTQGEVVSQVRKDLSVYFK